MSRRLEAALDDIPAARRQHAIRAYAELAAEGGRMSQLYGALVTELQLVQLREDAVFQAHEADLDAQSDTAASLPAPPQDGAHLVLLADGSLVPLPPPPDTPTPA